MSKRARSDSGNGTTCDNERKLKTGGPVSVLFGPLRTINLDRRLGFSVGLPGLQTPGDRRLPDQSGNVQPLASGDSKAASIGPDHPRHDQMARVQDFNVGSPHRGRC